MSRAVLASPRPDAQATATCRHCGNTFHPVEGRTEYCCTGCEYVHRLITGQNLDRFYALRRGASAPVRSVVFQPRDLRWLEGLVKRAEERAVGDEASLELDLQGISCVGCVWLIDKLARDFAGVRGTHINASIGRLRLRWTRGACDVVAFARELQQFGYLVGPASKLVRTESSAIILRLGLCAAFAMNGMLFSLPPYLGMEPDFPFAKLFVALSFLFATLSVLVGGTYFLVRAWRSLQRRVLHIDLPIALGILVGYGGSIYAWTQASLGFVYFDFVTTFTFLMLVGRWTQLAAVERNRNHLLGLRQDLPPVELVAAEASDTAHRVVATKPAEALDRGDRFCIGPGQVVPVSSTLLGPAGSLGLDWISGESEARAASPGQVVESGAINLSPHPLRLEALEPWGTSLLARLFAVPTPAEWRNRTLEQVIRVYLLAVLAVAVVGGTAWWLLSQDVRATLQVVVSVLVVSCPCAIGVTLPLIDELAVARLRHAGVFVRSETLWSRLARVRKVIFDKTGTLTLESLVLRDPEALAGLATEARVALWQLVRLARHPVASCLREAMLAHGHADVDTAAAVDPAREEVGLGLEWRDPAGRVWQLGRGSWIEPGAAVAGDVAFGCDGRVITWFQVAEEVRDDAVAEVARLQELGRQVYILSGDRAEKVAAMADRLHLARAAAVAGMTPEGKAAWVRQLDAGDTLMIGDGANDSLAFDAATCRGTPAIERGLLEHRADFVFLGRGLSGIRKLVEAAQVRRAAIERVLGFAVVYNLAVVAVALSGHMNPLVAAVVMPASALVTLAIATWTMRRV
ncbi:MAG: HAD family hydrolase [Opitutaceae bacterium]|nr:HAD family hydrolase [Opitutaceae bacterium]